MYTLGINAAFHDSSACLVRDGHVVAAAEEERFSRIKHGKRPVPFSAWELPYAAISGQRGENQTVVGFAAEHGGEAVDRARAKLARKGADLIVLNDVSDPRIGFESDENEVTLVGAEDQVEVPRASKDVVAEAILDRIDALRAAEPAG